MSKNVKWTKMPWDGYDMWRPDDGETLATVRKGVKFWTVKVFFGEAYQDDDELGRHLARYSKPSTACAAAEAAYRFYLLEEEGRIRKALAILDAQEGR